MPFLSGRRAAASLKLSELPMETSFSRMVARSASRARKAVNGRLVRRAFARGFGSGPRSTAWRVQPARRAAPGPLAMDRACRADETHRKSADRVPALTVIRLYSTLAPDPATTTLEIPADWPRHCCSVRLKSSRKLKPASPLPSPACDGR